MNKRFFFICCYVLLFSLQTGYVFAKCVKGDCKDGLGILVLREGYKYDGQFKEGRFHGYGTLTHSNGGKYEGGWRRGEYHGQGILLLPDGCKYVGGWKGSLPFGKGAWFSPTAKESTDSAKKLSQRDDSELSASANPDEIIISAPF